MRRKQALMLTTQWKRTEQTGDAGKEETGDGVKRLGMQERKWRSKMRRKQALMLTTQWKRTEQTGDAGKDETGDGVKRLGMQERKWRTVSLLP
eukprot:gene31774-6970_t